MIKRYEKYKPSGIVEVSKKKDLNKALARGEKSGYAKKFDPKIHLKKLHSKLK